MTPGNDAALADELERIASRDVAALERLYAATARRLGALCLRVTGDRGLAEEVLQDVYLKIWNGAPGFDRTRAGPMAWLATITRNAAIDAVRSRHRKAVQAGPHIDVSDSAPLADETMIRQERIDDTMDAIGRLHDEQKENIRSLFFDGLTYAQLAEREGIPVNTVKTRMRRLLARLGKELDDGSAS